MWQSRVEIEGYSVTYFNHIAVFEVPCRWTSIKGGAHTCFVEVWISNKSMKCIWAPALTEVQRYGASKAAKRSKYVTEWPSVSTRDCHIYHCTCIFDGRNVRVYPSILSTNKARPHPLTYITPGKQEGAVLVCEWLWMGEGVPNGKLFLIIVEQRPPCSWELQSTGCKYMY